MVKRIMENHGHVLGRRFLRGRRIHTLIILLGIFPGILLQDLDYLTPAVEDALSVGCCLVLARAHLSCPMVSPEPSSFDQPDEVDDSSFSHASSSGAVMLTRVLNSLP